MTSQYCDKSVPYTSPIQSGYLHVTDSKRLLTHRRFKAPPYTSPIQSGSLQVTDSKYNTRKENLVICETM